MGTNNEYYVIIGITPTEAKRNKRSYAVMAKYVAWKAAGEEDFVMEEGTLSTEMSEDRNSIHLWCNMLSSRRLVKISGEKTEEGFLMHKLLENRVKDDPKANIIIEELDKENKRQKAERDRMLAEQQMEKEAKTNYYALELDEKAVVRQKKLKSLFNKALISYSAYDFEWYYKVVNAYGGTKKDIWPYKGLMYEDMPVLFECIRAMSTKKVAYQTMLHNLYFMLARLWRPLSFPKVTKLVDAIRTEGVMPHPPQVFGDNSDFEQKIVVVQAADLSDPEQVKQLVTPIFENIDKWVYMWRLHQVYIRIDPPEGVEDSPKGDTSLFRAAFGFPELRPMLEVILQKIMEENKIYPLFEEYGNGTQYQRLFVGYPIIALFAAHDPKKYDAVLLEYMRDIEQGSPMDISLLQRIMQYWDKGNEPQLPLTFAAYPQWPDIIKNRCW